ncbi:MAG: hypothetical protein MUC29_12175 [Pyrinomonadaceae bacterium]|nr:hypothetical protein [Pyrinomonadaceae bacterium]
MKFLRFIALFLLVSMTFAQESPTESQTEKDKKKKEQEKQVLKMLDEAVSEAATLRIPKNRATVYAIAGDLYWKTDEKRSRQLFRDMANDIIASQLELEKEKKDSDDPMMMYSWNFDNSRDSLLPMVAKHDADFALELLLQTRPAKLTELIAKASQPKPKNESGMFNFDQNQWAVQREIQLEQRFAVLAAEQNPDKAIKLLRDSLSKGITYNVLELLNKINKKDADKAKSLASEVIQKISDTDLTQKREDFGTVSRMLQIATKTDAPTNPKAKPYKFTDSQIKDLANKVFSTFMQPSVNSMDFAMSFSNVQPILEKLLPEKSAMLKQKQTELNKLVPPEMKQWQDMNKLWNPNSTAEEILEMIPKMNESRREIAYEALGQKISKIEDESRAKKLIDQITDEKYRESANEKYQSAKINRSANAGKLDEAKKLIGGLGKKKNQIKKLVALAMEFQKKKTEKDLETAASLMRDAKAMTNELPEDEDELNDLMEVVKGYAVVNPNEAFRLFDPIVDQINDFVQASAILSKYNKRSNNFKKGELIFRSERDFWGEGLLIFRYIEQMQMLAKADFNRMSQFSDKFQRNDARTIVKLFVAQGFMKEEKPDDEKQFADDDNYFEFF